MAFQGGWGRKHEVPEREVERRVRELLHREKERWERGRRQEEEAFHTRKGGNPGTAATYERKKVEGETLGVDGTAGNVKLPAKQTKEEVGRVSFPRQCDGTTE